MTVLSSSLLSLKTARFSLKDSAKTLSSICMFWAFAPKRYKGRNIFEFGSTFCGDCLGKNFKNFDKATTISENIWPSWATKVGWSVARWFQFTLFGNEKGFKCRRTSQLVANSVLGWSDVLRWSEKRAIWQRKNQIADFGNVQNLRFAFFPLLLNTFTCSLSTTE